MSTQQNHDPSSAAIADLEAWAAAGDFHDADLSQAVAGDAAHAAGRALMEAAGVDVDAVAHSRVGPPR